MAKSKTKTIIRKIIVWGLIIFFLPAVLLGAPAYKLIALAVIIAVIIWDNGVSKKRPAATDKTTQSKEEPTIKQEAEYLMADIERPIVAETRDVFMLPKRPVIVVLFIVAVIAAYSLGYSTGKNTAVRLSNEQTTIAP